MSKTDDARLIQKYEWAQQKIERIGLKLNSNGNSISVMTVGGVHVYLAYSVDQLSGWADAVTELPEGLLASREARIKDSYRGYSEKSDQCIELHRCIIKEDKERDEKEQNSPR